MGIHEDQDAGNVLIQDLFFFLMIIFFLTRAFTDSSKANVEHGGRNVRNKTKVAASYIYLFKSNYFDTHEGFDWCYVIITNDHSLILRDLIYVCL